MAAFLVGDLRPHSFLWVGARRDQAAPCHAVPVGSMDLRAVPGPDDHDPAPPLPGRFTLEPLWAQVEGRGP